MTEPWNPGPKPNSGVPTRDETESAPGDAALTATLALLWLRRNTDDTSITRAVLRRVGELARQEQVYVARLVPCQCGGNGSKEVVLWAPTEGLEARKALTLVESGLPVGGDRLVEYTVRLSAPFGSLSDESVQIHVEDVDLDDECVSDVRSMDYGRCRACGRDPSRLADADALNLLAEAWQGAESMSYDDVERLVRSVLVRTRRLEADEAPEDPTVSFQPEAVDDAVDDDWLAAVLADEPDGDVLPFPR